MNSTQLQRLTFTIVVSMIPGLSFAQTAQETLAEETLFSCIASYAQSNNCNSSNWQTIQDSCNLAAVSVLQTSALLAQGVQNGQCTSQNWSSFSASVWAEVYPQ